MKQLAAPYPCVVLTVISLCVEGRCGSAQQAPHSPRVSFPCPCVLQVSRALGDYLYKQVATLDATKQQVSCEPEITVLKREEKDDYLILACDGIWDVMTNEDCIAFVRAYVRKGETDLGVVRALSCDTLYVLCVGNWLMGVLLRQICEKICDHCLGLNSRDNMTCCIVQLPGAVLPSPYVTNVTNPRVVLSCWPLPDCQSHCRCAVVAGAAVRPWLHTKRRRRQLR